MAIGAGTNSSPLQGGIVQTNQIKQAGNGVVSATPQATWSDYYNYQAGLNQKSGSTLGQLLNQALAQKAGLGSELINPVIGPGGNGGAQQTGSVGMGIGGSQPQPTPVMLQGGIQQPYYPAPVQQAGPTQTQISNPTANADSQSSGGQANAVVNFYQPGQFTPTPFNITPPTIDSPAPLDSPMFQVSQPVQTGNSIDTRSGAPTGPVQSQNGGDSNQSQESPAAQQGGPQATGPADASPMQLQGGVEENTMNPLAFQQPGTAPQDAMMAAAQGQGIPAGFGPPASLGGGQATAEGPNDLGGWGHSASPPSSSTDKGIEAPKGKSMGDMAKEIVDQFGGKKESPKQKIGGNPPAPPMFVPPSLSENAKGERQKRRDATRGELQRLNTPLAPRPAAKIPDFKVPPPPVLVPTPPVTAPPIQQITNALDSGMAPSDQDNQAIIGRIFEEGAQQKQEAKDLFDQNIAPLQAKADRTYNMLIRTEENLSRMYNMTPHDIERQARQFQVLEAKRYVEAQLGAPVQGFDPYNPQHIDYFADMMVKKTQPTHLRGQVMFPVQMNAQTARHAFIAEMQAKYAEGLKNAEYQRSMSLQGLDQQQKTLERQYDHIQGQIKERQEQFIKQQNEIDNETRNLASSYNTGRNNEGRRQVGMMGNAIKAADMYNRTGTDRYKADLAAQTKRQEIASRQFIAQGTMALNQSLKQQGLAIDQQKVDAMVKLGWAANTLRQQGQDTAADAMEENIRHHLREEAQKQYDLAISQQRANTNQGQLNRQNMQGGFKLGIDAAKATSSEARQWALLLQAPELIDGIVKGFLQGGAQYMTP